MYRIKAIHIFLYFCISFQLLASEPYVRTICQPWAKATGVQKDTSGYNVHWGTLRPLAVDLIDRARPDARRYAQRLATFRRMGSRYSSSQTLRRHELLGGCTLQNIEQNPMSVCNQYEVHCAVETATEGISRAFQNFNDCARRFTRGESTEHCGPNWTSYEGITSELNELKRQFIGWDDSNGHHRGIKESLEPFFRDPTISRYLQDLNEEFNEINRFVEEFDGPLAIALLRRQEEIDRDNEGARELAEEITAEQERQRQAAGVLNQCRERIDERGEVYLDQLTPCFPELQATGSEAVSDLAVQIETLGNHQADIESLRSLMVDVADLNIDQIARRIVAFAKVVEGNSVSIAKICSLSEGACEHQNIKKKIEQVVGEIQVGQTVEDAYNNYQRVAAAERQSCLSAWRNARRGAYLQEIAPEDRERIEAAREAVFSSMIGRLQGHEDFTDAYGTYDPDKCLSHGQGSFPHFPFHGDEELKQEQISGFQNRFKAFIAEAGDDIKEMNSIKNSLYTSSKNRLQDLMGEQVVTSPYLVRKVLAESGTEVQALWTCGLLDQEMSELAFREKRDMVVGGASALLALAAIPFTGGGSSLIGVGLLGSSVGGGLTAAGLSYHRTREQMDSASFSIRQGTADALMAAHHLEVASRENRFAMAEAPMILLPLITQVGRVGVLALRARGASSTVRNTGNLRVIANPNSSRQLSTRFQGLQGKLITVTGDSTEEAQRLAALIDPTDPALSGDRLFGGIMRRIGEKANRAGETIYARDFQEILHEIASEVGEDMALEVMAYVAIVEENPFTEEGFLQLAQSAVFSTSFASAGRILRRKMARKLGEIDPEVRGSIDRQARLVATTSDAHTATTYEQRREYFRSFDPGVDARVNSMLEGHTPEVQRLITDGLYQIHLVGTIQGDRISFSELREKARAMDQLRTQLIDRGVEFDQRKFRDDIKYLMDRGALDIALPEPIPEKSVSLIEPAKGGFYSPTLQSFQGKVSEVSSSLKNNFPEFGTRIDSIVASFADDEEKLYMFLHLHRQLGDEGVIQMIRNNSDLNLKSRFEEIASQCK